MRKSLLAAGFAAFVLSTTAAAAPLEPTGQWVVNFDDAQCIASRRYGDDTLVIKAPPLGEVVQLALFTRGNVRAPEQAEGSLRIDGGPGLRLSALVFNAAEGRQMIHSVNLPLADFARVRAAKRLEWRYMGANRDLALKGLEPLAKVMDDCVANLREVWNVRPTSEAEGSRRPSSPIAVPARSRASLATYVRSDDYPGVAIQQGQDGVVAFALLVNEQGRVADCTVVKTSGVAALDAQSCILLKQRARFTPATDAAGTPVKDAVLGRIRWQIRG